MCVCVIVRSHVLHLCGSPIMVSKFTFKIFPPGVVFEASPDVYNLPVDAATNICWGNLNMFSNPVALSHIYKVDRLYWRLSIHKIIVKLFSECTSHGNETQAKTRRNYFNSVVIKINSIMLKKVFI